MDTRVNTHTHTYKNNNILSGSPKKLLYAREMNNFGVLQAFCKIYFFLKVIVVYFFFHVTYALTSVVFTASQKATTKNQLHNTPTYNVHVSHNILKYYTSATPQCLVLFTIVYFFFTISL